MKATPHIYSDHLTEGSTPTLKMMDGDGVGASWNNEHMTQCGTRFARLPLYTQSALYRHHNIIELLLLAHFPQPEGHVWQRAVNLGNCREHARHWSNNYQCGYFLFCLTL